MLQGVKDAASTSRTPQRGKLYTHNPQPLCEDSLSDPGPARGQNLRQTSCSHKGTHTMMKWTSTALLMAVVAAPVAAEGTYGQVYGGFDQLRDSEFTGTIGGSRQNVQTDFDRGYTLGASVGRYFSGLSGGGYALRGEVELAYSNNDVDTVDFSGNGSGNEGNVSGDITSTRLMANVFADFKTQSALTPYVGAGLGVDFVDHDIVYGNTATIRGDDQALAAQLVLGASYQVSDSVSLFSDARFIRSYDVESTRTAPNGTTASVSDDLDRTNLNFGLRFKF